MQPRMSSIELNDTLALAYALHCQCSELSGPYDIASKNLRALHNALEKVFDIFGHAPTSRKDAALIQAVSECRRVLNAVDHALEYQDRQPLTNNKTNVKFTARIGAVTNRLMKAYDEFRKHASESSTISNTPMSSYHSSLASRPSCELEETANTVPTWTLLDSENKTILAPSDSFPEPSGRILPMAVDTRPRDLAQKSPGSMDSWKLPFALADPMSSDIDTASYLILAGDTTNTSQSDMLATPVKHSQKLVHAPFESASSCDKTLADYYSIHSSNRSRLTSNNSKPQYRVVNADPLGREDDSSNTTSEDGEVSDGESESVAPTIPRKNSRRALRRGSFGMARKRMDRVSPRECDADIDPKGGLSSPMHNRNNIQSSQPKECSESLHIHPGGNDDDANIEAAIIQSWNDDEMDRAEVHLERLLIRQPRSTSMDGNRRIRHLLGVIASLKGRCEHALSHFVSVFSTHILDPSQLDAGDCAAAYWMGDIYTLLNRRAEALIAYSIVEQGLPGLASGNTNHYEQLLPRIKAERKVCQDGRDKLFFELQLDEKMQCNASAAASILNSNIMPRHTVQKLLELTPWSLEYTHPARRNQSRAMGLSDIDPKVVQWRNIHKLQLSSSALMSTSPWPMPFDPLFASANIACGLSLSSERDLLHLQDIPRTGGALSRRRMNCFTCQNFHWLIKTLRACMERLELKFTEITSSVGTWLVPQYSFTAGSIASTHFISISIFRLTFRSGYGVEICPGGIFSSRITCTPETGTCNENSDEAPELKRIKKLIRSYLDAALRRQEAVDEQHTVIPVVSINGVTSLHMKTSPNDKRPESVTFSSPASSSRSESLFA